MITNIHTIKIKIYSWLLVTFVTWLFAYTARDFFILIRYFSNPDNLANDSLGYIVIGTPIIFIGIIIVTYEIIQNLFNKKSRTALAWFIAAASVITLMINYFAPKILATEIQPINYEQYLQQVQLGDRREQRKVAQMLQSDEKITILELDREIVGIINKNQNTNSKINLSQCKNSNEPKQKLINFLVKNNIAVYYPNQ
jgi:hypothetical protein